MVIFYIFVNYKSLLPVPENQQTTGWKSLGSGKLQWWASVASAMDSYDVIANQPVVIDNVGIRLCRVHNFSVLFLFSFA